MITGDREGAERFVRNSLAKLTNAEDLMVQRGRDSASQRVTSKFAANEVFQADQQVIFLRSVGDAVSQQSTLLMISFTSLKEKSTKLMPLAQEIENRAVMTVKGSYKKSMFAEGLLKLCKLALVDERVVDEILMIQNEIASGHTKLEMPGKTIKSLGDVDSLLKNTAQRATPVGLILARPYLE
ncbi:MAG: hypothetical protein LQ351_004416 [Letrouitia transgressa]|nr:MAG: hypothetical protein LQ351_004416 [Letrouitia transgressa]